METQIAFLRGINVGGHNIKMIDLKKLFEELDLKNVRTFIQSGNIFFQSEEKSQEILERKIEEHLYKSLGYNVPTFIRSFTELEETINSAPFKDLELTSDKRHFIIFSSLNFPDSQELPIFSPKKDFEIIGFNKRDAFVILDLNTGKPGNPSLFLEKLYKTKNTSRFYHTTIKILNAAKE